MEPNEIFVQRLKNALVMKGLSMDSSFSAVFRHLPLYSRLVSPWCI